MRNGGVVRALAFAAMAPACVLAQGSNIIRSETKVVLVDAVVTDKKGYVHDLTAKDFEVFEDDKKQTVNSFSSEADSAAVSKGQPHYMILLFDDSGMDNPAQRRAREAAIQFVDANAGPRQMIAIVRFSGALRVAQNFTDDAGRLKTVLGGGEASTMSVRRTAPDLTSATSLDARSLFLAVRSLARSLASAPGRKTLVLVSAASQLRPAEHGAEISAALDACNRANVAVYAIDPRGFIASPLGFGDHVNGAEPPRRSPIGGPNQGSGEIPEPADVSGNQQSALVMLAAGSGGFAISNTNDLAGGLEKIGKEQHEYYLLGYTPPDSPEGSCHKLRVKVNRGGVAVRARSGYCNARSNNLLAGTPVEKLLDSLPVSPPGGANASIQIPFFYTAENMARVNLAMEIPLHKLKAEKDRGKLRAAIRVLGMAHRPDGSVAARFSESVRLEFADEARLLAFLAAPFHYENQFDIVPGSYTVEIAYDAGDESRGKVGMPLTVDPYQPTQFALSGLALSRQYGLVSDPRLQTGAAWTADRTPLIAEGTRILPSGSNRFKKTDAPAVYAEIYEPLLVTPDPQIELGVGIGMRIFDGKTGEQKRDTGVLRIALPAATGNPAIPIAQRVPIDALAPGSYRLELEAGDTAGKTARRTIDFEIE